MEVVSRDSRETQQSEQASERTSERGGGEADRYRQLGGLGGRTESGERGAGSGGGGRGVGAGVGNRPLGRGIQAAGPWAGALRMPLA